MTPSLTDPKTQVGTPAGLMSIAVGSLGAKPTKSYFTALGSSQGVGGQSSAVLTTMPSWPNGATGFSINSADSVVKSSHDPYSEVVADMTASNFNIQLTGNGGKSIDDINTYQEQRKNFGAVLVQDIYDGAGVVSTVLWKNSNESSQSSARGPAGGAQHIRIPTAVGLDSSVSEYIYDFGLAQCDNAGCTSVSRVDKVHKDNNNDLTFYVEVFRPDAWADSNAHPVGNADKPDTPFEIQFSGVWHF